jgi:cytoskeletal protein CcmA (bactofilin family)
MGVFSKKNKIALDLQAISTLLSEGSTITGNLNAPAFTRIDGHVIGDVHIDEGMILGEHGTIEGNITTKEMIVYGTINGSIAVQSLEIKSTGKITGEIETGTLLVEAGGVYNGRLAMSSNHSKQ